VNNGALVTCCEAGNLHLPCH